MYVKTNIMKNIIYGLKDPRNDVFQYIGKSTVGNKRALGHLIKSHSEKVNEWVKSLNDNWLYPIVEIIEEVENLDDLPEREKYYINYYYEINPNLLNIQSIYKNINDTRTEEDEEKFNDLNRLMFELPNILRTERICRKLSQEEMAEKMGVNRGTVSLCERDGNVNLKTIKKYLLILKGIDLITKQKSERVRKT